MADDVLRFEDFEPPRGKAASLVRCARCGKLILATSTRCSECGIHFQGEAQDFIHPTESPRETGRHGPWIVAVALLLVVALVLGAIAMR
jgi:hypothetical protein